LLLCEALGFSPQLLLDDIINISNNAVQDGVNGMEEFLVKWVEEREERKAKESKEPEPPVKGKKGKKKAGMWLVARPSLRAHIHQNNPRSPKI
jgi:kinetochore protein Mis12/MTW1